MMRYETAPMLGGMVYEDITVYESEPRGPKEFPMGFDLRGSQGTFSGALTRAVARGSPMPPGSAIGWSVRPRNADRLWSKRS